MSFSSVQLYFSVYNSFFRIHFEKPTVASPLLVETKGSKEVLRFHYQTLYLPDLDARLGVLQGAVPVYGLLPAMGHRSDELLLQAIEEVIEYCKEDIDLLRVVLKCFAVLFRRAKPLPTVQFERVDRRLRMFDQLLEEDPWVKEKVAEGEARGIAKGEAKARTEELVRLVQGRASLPRASRSASKPACLACAPRLSACTLHILQIIILSISGA